ncbi:TonB-dependent receptor [Candidatus Poribacteria bacterium]|nr:MAG: TonB-dependent receptor [Candidatus Poribacteria bacterium]
MKVAFDFKMVILLTQIVLAVFISLTSIVIAQETEVESSETTSEQEVITLEEMVVVGTRAKPRSVLESAVPIDVLPSEDFVKQGSADLPDLLRNLVPSYNVNAQPIADAATVVRPANLRGLAPDHTLLLVNGKRRHRASVIAWLGNGMSDGAQGADLSPIPSIALKQVEVLRDGASAQYGSDAIAGVMNLQLKDSYKGGSFEIKPGIFQAGDGLSYALAGNIGLGREDLWTNLSVEYGGMNETDRSIQRDDAAALINAGNADVADPAQPWGHPIIRNDIKLFANYGASMTDDVQFYGHANYAQKEVEGGFYFRNPNTRGAVFSNSGGETLLVGNLRGLTAEMAAWEARKLAAEAAGQAFNELSPHDADDVPITNNVPDPVALQQVFSDPNLFTFQELFPGGFTPRFGADTQDASLLVGLKGTIAEDLGWDLSASYGRHASDFFIRNTVNASLGPDTPTEFDPGNYIQADTNINLDLTYPLHDMVFLASGLEYRTETFEIVRGQIESWEIGPLASQGFSSGSNGFPGFSDIAEGTWTRSNFAGYLESELRPVDFWTINAAVRGEYFDDFGSTINYKIATNYGIADTLKSLLLVDLGVDLRARGSYSTGFRAPTPGQQNAFNVTTEFGENNTLVNKGTIPSTHGAARFVGGKALEPEKSKNFTVGTVVSHAIANITVDYFNITVEDRLAPSRDFNRGTDITEAQIQQLVAEGITSAGNLQEFRFFTNEFETSTQGIDVILTAPLLKGALSIAYNYTGTEVTKHDPDILNEVRINLIQEGIPRHRGNVTLTQAIGNSLGVLGRVNYYGPWYENAVGAQTYDSAFLVDLEVSYAVVENLGITIGVNNVLNVEPDNITSAEGPPVPFDIKEFPARIVGRPFGEYSPYGFGGAFWYTKIGYSF